LVTILIVEDDKKLHQFYTDALGKSEREINTIIVENGEDALELLSKNDGIDGIFLDIGLPGISGFSLAMKIHEMETHHFTPVVFATGTEKECLETYKQYHNFDHIEKPFSETVFLEALNRVLAEIEFQKKLPGKKEERKIVFRHDDGYAIILFSDILYARTFVPKTFKTRNIKLVTYKKEYFRTDITLSNLVTEIGESSFVQCSKSCIVNLSNIDDFIPITKKLWDIHFRDASDEENIKYKSDGCKLTYNYRDNMGVFFRTRKDKK